MQFIGENSFASLAALDCKTNVHATKFIFFKNKDLCTVAFCSDLKFLTKFTWYF